MNTISTTSLLLFLAMMLFSWNSLASEDTCSPARACYQGERIVFLTEPRIDDQLECNRGKSLVSVYCEPEGSQEMCDKGKVLVCRFCDTGDADTDDGTGIHFQASQEVCESLENTPKDFDKKILTEEELYSIKDHLIERLNAIINEIYTVSQGIEPDHIKLDYFANNTYEWVRRVNDLISNETGLNNTFDRLGTSNTTTRLRKQARVAKDLWDDVAAKALAINPEEVEGFKLQAQEVTRLYTEILKVVETFEYKPQTE